MKELAGRAKDLIDIESRHFAELSGKNPREIVRNLPEAAWNYEP